METTYENNTYRSGEVWNIGVSGGEIEASSGLSVEDSRGLRYWKGVTIRWFRDIFLRRDAEVYQLNRIINMYRYKTEK